MICIPDGTQETLLETFVERVRHNVMSFVFSLVVRLTDLDYLNGFEISDGHWKVLLCDPKFMHLLDETNKSF
jgi:hypothetical protein